MVAVDLLEFFRTSYLGLTGHPEPFPWQESLFIKLCEDDIPKELDLPTGCGKTSAMAVWLLALARQAQAGPESISLPRRLVWVVNRRVVVDQATREAEELRQRLREARRTELDAVRSALRTLSATENDNLIGISTLRGQFADNAEWSDDPSRPAVVVGTVDMIGSRLLFSGYGRGFKSRPLHAAFIGQDALLIHDEAHLEPAFQELVAAVEAEQVRCGDLRRFQVMALTATSRSGHDNAHTLTSRDLEPGSEVSKRVHAKKWIALHVVEDEKAVTEVFQRAMEYRESGQAILIFLRTIRDVSSVVDKLRGENLNVQRLTGTLRGYERDQLANADPVFARFMKKMTAQAASGTVYLVCTAAGEVGVDMSADHLVCDLTPFDSMAQRLGRVNRFGEGDARVDVVCCSPSSEQAAKKKTAQLRFEQACQRTLELLRELPQRADGRYDGSPAALGELPAAKRQAAFTPPPNILATSEILFDAWALTSVREKLPGRPPVADWLHGIPDDWEPPQAYVAWREEVGILNKPELLAVYKPEDLLEDYPLKPHELLRDVTLRVAEQLELIAESSPDEFAWIVEPDGSVEVTRLGDLIPRDKQKRRTPDLGDCTVLLPPAAGGLEKGILNGRLGFDEAAHGPYDLADRWIDEKNRGRRCRVWDDDQPPEGMRLVRTIDTRLPEAEDEPGVDEQHSTRRYWRWYVRPRSADDDGSKTAQQDLELEPHIRDAQKLASGLTSKLSVGPPEALAVSLASGWHDLGKRRAIWQRSIGNGEFPSRVLAKSERKTSGVSLSQYRHEFGSLIDLTALDEFGELKIEVQDLLLHLVAAHHGRARPHFPTDEAFDPDASMDRAAEIAQETPRRFARLQRKYGRWGLAYLESLVRAADWLASQGVEPAPQTDPMAEGAQ
jgi:CRISPR-associated endonuclease/helicase Cas3